MYGEDILCCEFSTRQLVFDEYAGDFRLEDSFIGVLDHFEVLNDALDEVEEYLVNECCVAADVDNWSDDEDGIPASHVYIMFDELRENRVVPTQIRRKYESIFKKLKTDAREGAKRAKSEGYRVKIKSVYL